MRVRTEHWQVLLDVCERNPELITNKFNGADGKNKGNILWQNLAQKLNSLGYGEKSKEDWRRALTDWKCKTKAKASKIKKDIDKTGGGPANHVKLSDLEARLLALMGTTAIYGDNVQELGFRNTNTSTTKTPTLCILKENDSSISNDQIYAEEENTNTSPQKEKRKISDTRPVKRVRTVQTQRLSQSLIDMNYQSLQILRNISKNIESISDSLKIMTTILQKHNL